MNLKAAVQAIEKYGIILVFPIHNRKEPFSLWSHFFPRSEMKWEWDDQGDNRVSELWKLKVDLSETNQVVYTKWYQGRATYFSKTAFIHAFNTINGKLQDPKNGLSRDAEMILKTLEQDSPLSTKDLKKQAEMRGKSEEARYTRAMKELWNRLLIVAYGEVDDGAFPSLAVGATQVLFEDLWIEAPKISQDESMKWIHENIKDRLFLQFLLKQSMGVTPKIKKGSKVKSPHKTISKVIRYEDL